MNNPAIIKDIKGLLSKILPPDSRAVLFGSRARGEEHIESDWDIHILIPGEEVLECEIINKYASPLENLGWDWDQDFSVLVYSYKGWAKRSFLPFYKNVEKDKIILYQS